MGGHGEHKDPRTFGGRLRYNVLEEWKEKGKHGWLPNWILFFGHKLVELPVWGTIHLERAYRERKEIKEMERYYHKWAHDPKRSVNPKHLGNILCGLKGWATGPLWEHGELNDAAVKGAVWAQIRAVEGLRHEILEERKGKDFYLPAGRLNEADLNALKTLFDTRTRVFNELWSVRREKAMATDEKHLRELDAGEAELGRQAEQIRAELERNRGLMQRLAKEFEVLLKKKQEEPPRPAIVTR